MIALVGMLLILSGVGTIVIAVLATIIFFAGVNPGSIGALGYVSIYGYPLVGAGATLLMLVGLTLVAVGGVLRQ